MKTFKKFRKFRIVARVVLQTKECKAILSNFAISLKPPKKVRNQAFFRRLSDGELKYFFGQKYVPTYR